MTFSSAVMCGNRLKRWKTMPMSRALAAHLAVLQLVQLVAVLAVADQLAVDVQPPGVDLLQVVDAAQERRLAGAGGADEAEDLARLDLEVDALEDLEMAERLVDAFGADHRLRHQWPTPPPGTGAVFILVAALTPREKRFSRKYCPISKMLLSARYHRHAATSIGNTWNVRLPTDCS